MRFDMHCHTKEGSLDGHVPLKDYVRRLKELGYDGMMITDHNSYKAYRYYTRNANDEVFRDFVVLKGIEYDTPDAGHILVVMPSDTSFRIFEFRGMPVRLLIEIVHACHGILGPAHPTGEKYLSITNCRYYHKHPEVISQFDFIEVYNSCISEKANEQALALAEQYNLPQTAGTDAHKMDCIGLAHTDFNRPITSESDLIDYIKSTPVTLCEGTHYLGTSRDHLGYIYDMQLRLWYLYNKFANMLRASKRVRELVMMASENNNLVRRIVKLMTTGADQDMVQSRHHRRAVNRNVNRVFQKRRDLRIKLEEEVEEVEREEQVKLEEQEKKKKLKAAAS